MLRKIEKKPLVSLILTSELVPLNCLYSERNTCHHHSVCLQTVLRFCVALKETFFNSITFTVIKKYGKAALVQIATMF